MNFFGVEVDTGHLPELDQQFIPLGRFIDAYSKGASKPISIALHRNGELVSVYDTFVHGIPKMREADFYYTELLLKFLLWTRGGAHVVVYGDDEIAAHLAAVYSPEGERSFDYHFMSKVYERTFELSAAPLSEKISSREQSMPIGGNWDGCRIGFDAGGSDRKVSAVIDGETVYSEEVVWHPKLNSDPEYHRAGIAEAFRTAASKMPRVDAIGVSSAGIYINNRTMVASLFLKIPEEPFEKTVKNIYIDVAKEFGDVPLAVANDGDVSALAGMMELGEGRVLGVAMGTSEAVGYVDESGNITGWLNEFAFAPVDCAEAAMRDEWSGDIGCGVKYFSQDAVIKLAEAARISLDRGSSPAEKLKVVQGLVEADDPRAAAVFRSIGVYLGHTLPLYCKFYDIKHVLLLGRVMSGKGGALIVSAANDLLHTEYSNLYQSISLQLPDEQNRRTGQSVASAGLPAITSKN